MTRPSNNEISRIVMSVLDPDTCWHERREEFTCIQGFRFMSPTSSCGKCGKTVLANVRQQIPVCPNNPDLFTPEGFFLALELAKKQEWWEKFNEAGGNYYLPLNLIDPTAFADALYDFFKETRRA